MPKQTLRVDENTTELNARFHQIRAAANVPESFPSAVEAEAARVASAPLSLPDRDETAIPFFTIDPAGSMDLDQAMHLSRDSDGYRVRYAITYLPAFIAPGGAIDTEARTRGETIYCPDERTPLHPPVLSEGAASLLPDQVRAAYVWDIALDAQGAVTTSTIYLARVKSVNRYDYNQVQESIDNGTAEERVALLKEIGVRRTAQEAARGGASLPMPEQEVDRDEDGAYHLTFRPPVPAEEWNAQISLLAGMVAAKMMVDAKVGILRTMPAPDHAAVQRFRRQAKALGIQWGQDERYGDFLRRLDRTNPKQLALIYDATSLFRGASYTPIDGSVPADPEHAAVASIYAHVTAPLRRLVDRFGLAVCEAIASGSEVPDWARQALPSLPDIMRRTDSLANSVQRQCTDAAEAAALSSHVGQDFDAVIVEQTNKGALLQLLDPAVVAHAQGPGQPGDAVRARLTKADLATGSAQFQIQ
ncbi:MAG: RNB domain-containing ribonuclease [Nostocoides sp.]